MERERSLLQQLSDAVVIDKHNLDEAWVQQPDIFWRVCDQLARANNRRDKFKLERDRTIAQVEAEVRIEYERVSKRATDRAVTVEVEEDARVVDVRKEYQRLCFEAERWLHLKEAYQQRSYALKDLTGLHLANYYQTNTGSDRRAEAADRNRLAAGEERRTRSYRAG